MSFERRFAPLKHSHSDLYYTEAEVDALLSGKADASHTHLTSDITNLSSYTGFDARYYTESEVDTLLSNYLQASDNATITGKWDFSKMGDITFQTGATGGTLRTGTSNADKFELQAYDVDGGTYVTMLELDAGNTPRLQFPVQFLEFEDGPDRTKIMQFDLSSISTATTRTVTWPDENVTIGNLADLTANEAISGAWTFSDDIRIANSQYIYWKNAANADVGALTLWSNDNFYVGASGYDLILRGSSLELQGAVTATSSIAATGAVTGSNLNVSNWDTAYGWGDHAAAGYAASSHTHAWSDITGEPSFLLDTTDTFTGTLTVNGNVNIDGIYLDEASFRAGILEVNREGANSWAGYGIYFSGTSQWVFMAAENNAGIYDDYNNNWHLYCAENSYTQLRHNGATKLQTASTGISVTGGIDATDSLTFSTGDDNRGIVFGTKVAMSSDGTDNWLRLNNSGHFTNGIYSPGKFQFNGQMKKYNGGHVLYYDSSTYAGGGKITISGTAPTSPSTGDVWFDTS